MKLLNVVTAALVVAGFAHARSPMRPPTSNVAPLIASAQISDVGTQGEVLKVNHNRPYTEYVVSIPAKVGTGSACVKFVGVQTDIFSTRTEEITKVRALATTNALIDACIQIYTLPVDIKIPVRIKVLTGGFAAADDIQTRTVDIDGAGTFTVSLDMGNNSVTIYPAYVPH